jgi:tetratricopeptide (TPR) repeat protein
MKDNGLLLVLDNHEHLLDEQATWRDDRWAALIAALTGHDGESRVVLTSRTRPADIDPDAVRVLPIHALSLAETALLARELPNLRRLLGVDATARGDHQLAEGRDLLGRTLTLVQGHPKLLELADAAAAHPNQLAQHLDQAEATTAAGGGGLQTFLTTGTTSLDPEAFLTQLSSWTTSTAASLPEPSRLLLQILCCIADDDRTRLVLDGNWADLWTRLDRPGDPPDLDQTLTPLIDAALVHPETHNHDHDGSADGGDGGDGGAGEPGPARYRIHPGVADTIRVAADPDLQAAVDTELAAYWNTMAKMARERPGGEATWLVVHAGLAAAPYLMRLGEWNGAAGLLEQAKIRDQSPATIRAVIPHLRRIADTTSKPAHAGILGSALLEVDTREAEQWLRRAYDGAVAADDHRLAAAGATQLVNVLQAQGRLREALRRTEAEADHVRRAGLGPASVLAAQGHRLQILGKLGQHRHVLNQFQALRPQLDQLPDQTSENETIEPWNAREVTLVIGRDAAAELGEWETALELNRDIVANIMRRGAGVHEIARARFNDYTPLIRLGRLDDADQLLRDCQEVYEEQADTGRLGGVLSARADLEDERGRPDQAAALERTGLRYLYIRDDWDGAIASHNNLAHYLKKTGAPPGEWLAHRIAAASIEYAARGSATRIYNLAGDLRLLGDNAPLPNSFAELTSRVEALEGVRFGQLITRLTDQPGDQLLTETVQLARQQIAADDQALADRWEPRIAAVVAAAQGNSEAAAAVEPILAELAGTQDWAALVPVLRRMIAGDRGEALLTGLDPVDTAITQRTLDALAGRVELSATPADLNAAAVAIPEQWEPVIAAVAAAAEGDTEAATALEPVLTDLAGVQDWVALVPVLRRIIAGDRGEDLLAGLDPVDTAITSAVLTALADQPDQPPEDTDD